MPVVKLQGKLDDKLYHIHGQRCDVTSCVMASLKTGTSLLGQVLRPVIDMIQAMIGSGGGTDRPGASSGLKKSTTPAVNFQGKRDAQLWRIHGQRYDLTEFVARHPGGTHAVMMGLGEDCTALFESYHPFTGLPKKVLKRYRYDGPVHPLDAAAAAVADSGTFFEWKNTPIWDEIKTTAIKHFSPRGDETAKEVIRNSKATNSALAVHGLGLLVLIPTVYYWAQLNSIMALFCMPLVYWLVCSSLMHNGSHFAMSTVPWVNKVSAYMGSLHVQFHLWAVQHVIGHHIFTNIIDYDPDTMYFAHADKDEKAIPGFRLQRGQIYLAKYQLLWRAAVGIHMCASTIAMSLLNVPKFLASGFLECTRIPKHYRQAIKTDRIIMVGCCVLFAMFNPANNAGLASMAMLWSWIIHGIIYNIFSQLSHVAEESLDGTTKYLKDNNLKKIEWSVHQMLTAIDYNCDSPFWCYASINLNSQIVHHLFPSVHPCHYPALRKALLPVAKKHGVDYEGRSNFTFMEMLNNYGQWLYARNERAEGFEGETEELVVDGVATLDVAFDVEQKHPLLSVRAIMMSILTGVAAVWVLSFPWLWMSSILTMSDLLVHTMTCVLAVTGVFFAVGTGCYGSRRDNLGKTGHSVCQQAVFHLFVNGAAYSILIFLGFFF